MREVALGAMQMPLEEWEDITPRDFFAKYKGWRRNQLDNYKQALECARLAGFLAVSPHIKGSSSPQKLLPFEWETKKEDFWQEVQEYSDKNLPKRIWQE